MRRGAQKCFDLPSSKILTLQPFAVAYTECMTTNALFIPAGELANLLGLPVGWLKLEAKAGRLPCIRAGRRLMFDPALVRAELLRRSRGGAILFVEVGNGGGYRILSPDDLREGAVDA